MSVYNSSNSDISEDEFGVQPGGYECLVEKAEVKTGGKGDYLALTIKCNIIEGNVERTMFLNMFPNATSDYPKKVIDRFLTINGFNVNGNVEISDWQLLVNKKFIAICRGEEDEYQGNVTIKFRPHSMYNMQFKSSSEIMENKEPEKYGENLIWVNENPLKKIKEVTPF